ncbi:hypothetical protein [Vreelandella populi]|uniref:hypothetical protein n=1 Tax=Vreelandella populi TaxID=2498858 RepID=UPI000F8C7078|nr:hypothetical protein [Halomonas populi]RUR53804.1 hypothetical protein ELY40_10585 [Halomonas populi]
MLSCKYGVELAATWIAKEVWQAKSPEKTLSALEHQERTADIAWRQDFVKGFGKQSKPMRDQLKQKTQRKLEASFITGE